MNCPHCNIPLMMAERKGVEIDFCSQCRGVWLDKGELDKIIDLSMQDSAPRRETKRPQQDYQDEKYRPTPSQDYHYGHKHSNRHQPYYKHKKRKSVLGEIFDIF